MFVDDDWNIVGFIDFEYAPVQPAQKIVHVPTWLSDQDINDLHGPALAKYEACYDQFVDTLEEEETASQQGHSLSQRLRQDWKTGRLLYNAALRSSNRFPIIFEQNIRPTLFDSFDLKRDGTPLMRMWSDDC